MKILYAALAVAISGCATTYGSAPTVSKSGFDGSTVVDISPHGNDCSRLPCSGLGAQWSSADPSTAILKVQLFGEITAITGAKLNIDGRVLTLQPTHNLTQFDKSTPSLKISIKDYVISMSDLRQIGQAKRAWLRVSTPGGYTEDRIIEGSSDSMAYNAIRRFLDSVSVYQVSEK